MLLEGQKLGGQPVPAATESVGGDGPGKLVVVANAVGNGAFGIVEHNPTATVLELARVLGGDLVGRQVVSSHLCQFPAILGQHQVLPRADGNTGAERVLYHPVQLPTL